MKHEEAVNVGNTCEIFKWYISDVTNNHTLILKDSTFI